MRMIQSLASLAVVVLCFSGNVNAGQIEIGFNTGETGWSVSKIKTLQEGNSLEYAKDFLVNPESAFETASKVTAGNGWDAGPSQWISTNANGQDSNGFFAYNYSFNFSGEGVLAALDGRFLVDDHIEAIYFNGFELNFIAQSNSFDGWLNLTTIGEELGKLALNNGNNILTFIAHNNNSKSGNAAGLNPTGFNGDFTITAATASSTTPEPATIAIFGFGMLGAGIAARRRVKRS